MSGAGTGPRAFAALAFGAGGAASAVPLALFLSAVVVWPAAVSGAAVVLALVLAFGVGGAVMGWRGGGRVAAPAPPETADGWGLPPSVSRGMGVAFRGFALGCALFPAAAALATLGTTLAAGGAVGAPTVRTAILAIVGQVVGFLAAGAVGSFTVLPVALALGGAAGWLVARGAAPPAR